MALVATAAARLATAALLVVAGLGTDADSPESSPWYETDGSGEVQVHLYYAWSSTCPHCLRAGPVVEELDDRYPWLIVHSLPLNLGAQENVELAMELAGSIGQEVTVVPTFLYCETMRTGFESAESTGVALESDLVACKASAEAALSATEPDTAPEATGDESISVPVLGSIDPDSVSLPAFTVVIAAFDAFNPCAFFVLLFLLSLLVHARSRSRMALIGGTFVLVSGLLYFAFMVAWLNVFLVFGALPAVTILAGMTAVVMGAFNIKDYFWFEKGVSLSIPRRGRGKLLERMRKLTQSAGFPLILAGTVTLAFVANAYELLCTAGFPLIFTRVLTFHELPRLSYYLYLVLYNVVYVIPLLAIVAVFVWRFGSRKLSHQAGRTLKLISGLMMLGLGLVLVFASSLAGNILTAPLILAGALAVTWLVSLAEKAGGSHQLPPRPRGDHS